MPMKKNCAAIALALSLGLGLSACGSGPQSSNASLNSVNQPVVERSNFTLDLATNASGLPVGEQARLANWFETLGLGYGDRVGIDDAVNSAAVHEDVSAIAGRFGILLADGAPVTVGFVDPGHARIVVTRSTASVPGCPAWKNKSMTSLGNKTREGFGCSVNGNMAAMIADPSHLLKGAEGSGETIVMSSTKAITAYRDAEPTGTGGLSSASSQSGGQ